ncbi:I66 family serine proteinase inhibitor [Streptomyces pinistramenti]|uniref:I66 family serine proteinase inhibitor n=1 Tax=Streptomyces pinistramenti TaxID=2884812 RepID=UPI001D08D42F|nr:I66 family serine proteinase inhibitor [Streptomyces pinistramenti]MCB5909267.1 I66 family serine proteinase inhibitor [Streptomyces pinistramenti]
MAAGGLGRRGVLKGTMAGLAGLAVRAPLAARAASPGGLRDLTDRPVTLTVGGAPAVVIRGRLYAKLLDVPETARWIIRRQPDEGQDVYTVESERGEGGLVAPVDGEDQQLTVQPLAVLPALSPRFTPNELWRLAPADDQGPGFTLQSWSTGRYAGRQYWAEDRSLNPKKVAVLPREVSREDARIDITAV